ncbi:hypothetical protein KCU83_g89, partial [Aureobasidium melanogenum]
MGIKQGLRLVEERRQAEIRDTRDTHVQESWEEQRTDQPFMQDSSNLSSSSADSVYSETMILLKEDHQRALSSLTHLGLLRTSKQTLHSKSGMADLGGPWAEGHFRCACLVSLYSHTDHTQRLFLRLDPGHLSLGTICRLERLSQDWYSILGHVCGRI